MIYISYNFILVSWFSLLCFIRMFVSLIRKIFSDSCSVSVLPPKNFFLSTYINYIQYTCRYNLNYELLLLSLLHYHNNIYFYVLCIIMESLYYTIHNCHLNNETCGQTFCLGRPLQDEFSACWWWCCCRCSCCWCSEILRGLVGTITTGGALVTADDDDKTPLIGWPPPPPPPFLSLFPVKRLTVLCIKSVFWPAAAVAQPTMPQPDEATLPLPQPLLLLLSWRFDVEDMEWHLTTRGGALPPDQSVLALELLLPLIDPRRPAELDLYGGGDSDSNTVRFGGGFMHFWYISASCRGHNENGRLLVQMYKK